MIILFILAVVFAFNSFDLSKDDYINYTEKSNIDYKVYLKENDFYEDEYLPKDMIYVASLIDNIKIDLETPGKLGMRTILITDELVEYKEKITKIIELKEML